MNELIQIANCKIGAENVNSVNTRELYDNLELAKGQYSRWIKSNLLDLFEEHFDFIGVRQTVEGNNVISYFATMDTAKHLCMIAKTEKAMEFRRYFIEVEKESKKPKTELELIIQSAKQMQLIQEKQEIQNEQITEVREKVDYLENKSPVSYNQLKALEDKRKAKTRELVGYNPEDLKSTANYTKTIRILTKKFKDRFCIARYADLPKDKFDEALSWLDDVSLIDLI